MYIKIDFLNTYVTTQTQNSLKLKTHSSSKLTQAQISSKMNFEIQRNLVQETVLKKKKNVNTKEEGSFATHFYDPYNIRLKRKIKEEMTSEATQGKKITFMEASRLGRKLAPAINEKVDEILEKEKETHCRHVSWEKKVEVIQEIHSVEEWNLLNDYRFNWERRNLERERMEIKMKVQEILSSIVSSIV